MTHEERDKLLSLADDAEAQGCHLTAHLMRHKAAQGQSRLRLAAIDGKAVYAEPWPDNPTEAGHD